MFNIVIPSKVLTSFPLISQLNFIRTVSSEIPLAPDTTFALFANENGEYTALVCTDYIALDSQSDELKRISGEHAFTFDTLILPGEGQDSIPVDDAESANFFVRVPHKNHQVYYYLVQLT